jgi:PAS domain S-box-containing protein
MRPDQPKQPPFEPGAAFVTREEVLRRREEVVLARERSADAVAQLTKQANEKLVVATLRSQELAEEAQGFRLLVESVKDHAIFMLDPAGYVTTWNPGAERIKGYSSTEIVGKHYSIFYSTADVAAGRCQRELEIAERDGRFEEEGALVRKDGSQFWANVVITALRDETGKLIGFGKVTHDLTERVRMDQERLQLMRAEAAERSKDEFLAVMGHELRNPLAPMLTAVDLIKLRGARAYEKEIAILDRQLRHMIRLVDDLLDISRITRDKLQLSRKVLEISDVIQNAVDVASPLVQENQHRLLVDVPASGLLVHADPERMAQVFGNLLNNAAKYTEPGGEIRVFAGAHEHMVEVTVEDTGMGIAPELMPRLFDLFAQGAQGIERQLGGLGIGLAIARRLVNGQGGEITAESDGPGRGSRFTVRLPRVDGREVAPPTTRPPPHKHVWVRRRVLLVDDNEDVGETMSLLLGELGHETRFALDGPHALQIAQDFKPDIVFLDIGLPGMDGFEVARRMREIAACAKIPIIALSGYARESDQQRALKAGFSGHLPKPVDLEHIEQILERAESA